MGVAKLLVILTWAVLAASVVMRLSRHGAAAFDDRLDRGDRRLVGMSAFYLAAPALSLAAQVATLALAHALDVEVARFDTWILWGGVELGDSIDPVTRASLAAAGPLALLALAAALLAWTSLVPSRAAVNHLTLETARVLLIVAFAVQPIVSLLAQRGDLFALRRALNELHPQAGEAALLGYGVIAAWALWQWRRARRLRALGTPLHDAVRRARERLERDPSDRDARLALAAAQLASGDPHAIATLEQARAHIEGDPRLELLLGRAHLERGHAEQASEHLREAGLLLEGGDDRHDLLLEVTLALGAARIALGDAEGAILTAEAARDAAPRDPRTLLIHADALVLGGRRDEARGRLERALDDAEGALRREIRRRLAALR